MMFLVFNLTRGLPPEPLTSQTNNKLSVEVQVSNRSLINRNKRAFGILLQSILGAMGFTVSPIRIASLPDSTPAATSTSTAAQTTPGLVFSMPGRRETIRLTGLISLGSNSNNTDLLRQLTRYENFFHGSNSTTTTTLAPSTQPPIDPRISALFNPLFMQIPLPTVAPKPKEEDHDYDYNGGSTPEPEYLEDEVTTVSGNVEDFEDSEEVEDQEEPPNSEETDNYEDEDVVTKKSKNYKDVDDEGEEVKLQNVRKVIKDKVTIIPNDPKNVGESIQTHFSRITSDQIAVPPIFADPNLFPNDQFLPINYYNLYGSFGNLYQEYQPAESKYEEYNIPNPTNLLDKPKMSSSKYSAINGGIKGDSTKLSVQKNRKKWPKNGTDEIISRLTTHGDHSDFRVNEKNGSFVFNDDLHKSHRIVLPDEEEMVTSTDEFEDKPLFKIFNFTERSYFTKSKLKNVRA